MADEQPKKSLSEPPPATDEIDQEWGTTPAPAPHGARKAAAESDREEVEEDEEDDDEEDDDEEDGDEEDGDEEDDDEEDDDEEDAHATARRSASARDATRQREPTGNRSNDWLPDWSPWAVLAGLIAIGLIGGLGLFGGAPQSRASAAEPAAEAPSRPAADAPVANEPQTVQASHLLVAYQGAMRASPTTTRTKDEAKKRAQEALAKAKTGTPFETLVSEYSDEPGAAARKGSLGSFTRDRMVKPFADAAFALKPGQLSGIVETDFGYHVILRTK